VKGLLSRLAQRTSLFCLCVVGAVDSWGPALTPPAFQTAIDRV
jgi:hypothetical protein